VNNSKLAALIAEKMDLTGEELERLRKAQEKTARKERPVTKEASGKG
jgi:hypothetical protein